MDEYGTIEHILILQNENLSATVATRRLVPEWRHVSRRLGCISSSASLDAGTTADNARKWTAILHLHSAEALTCTGGIIKESPLRLNEGTYGALIETPGDESPFHPFSDAHFGSRSRPLQVLGTPPALPPRRVLGVHYRTRRRNDPAGYTLDDHLYLAEGQGGPCRPQLRELDSADRASPGAATSLPRSSAQERADIELRRAT